MKKIVLLYIFVFTVLFPSDSIEEYQTFTKAKNNYINGNFNQAKIGFENSRLLYWYDLL